MRALAFGAVLAMLAGSAVAQPKPLPQKEVSSAKVDDTRSRQLLQEAQTALQRGDYPAAIRLLEGVVAKDQRNADGYNLLAYSIRKSGDPAKSIPIYEKALAIDPKHKGAHEYIGEAYLALGDLDKAKQHLATLDKLCFFPCEEYTDLKKAVQAYESSGGQVKPASQTKP